MALIKADRVKETTTTTGTGSFTLAGPVAGYRAFSSVMATGDFCYYTAINPATNEWECGVGTFTAPSTLARTRVESSSNSGSAVNFGSGTKEVFLSVTANQVIGGEYPLNGFNQNASIYLGHKVHANGTTLASSQNNVMIGNQAFFWSGNSGNAFLRNVGIGTNAFYQLNSDAASPGISISNTAIGFYAGSNIFSSSNCVFLGAGSSSSTTSSLSNCIVIGAYAVGHGNHTTTIGSEQTTDCYIAGHLHPSGAIRPASIADASAPTNALYFSTDANKLVYKDSGGTVNNLY